MIQPESSYDAALQFLLGRIDYERVLTMPYSGRDFKLDRMRELLRRLGNPQDRLPILHVAGTKGKGSTAAMLAAVLTAAGYRVGMFSSPHFDRIEERFAIGGQPCSADELVERVEEIRPAVDAMDREAAGTGEIGPTYFEITTALALLHFVRRKVDAAVLEVGLGGRLDSTNVCTPRVCIITSISFDHTEQLGNTLGAIAREKAGIVKPGVPVVSGVEAPEAREVIAEVCRRQGAPLIELGVDFTFDYQPPQDLQQSDSSARLGFRRLKPAFPSLGAEPPGAWVNPDAETSGTTHPTSCRHRFAPRNGRALKAHRGTPAMAELVDLELSLSGRHQAANAALALAALAELGRAGWRIDEGAIGRGFGSLRWPGRVEVVRRRPAVVLDVAHNVASIEALLATLDESFSVRRRHLIFAVSKDKDARGMLALLLTRFDTIALTRYLNNPRSVPPEQLAEIAYQISGRHHPMFSNAAEAWAAVEPLASPDDLICATGSFFIVAEMRRLFVGE
ncbi:MAG: folylpolyglutamate synthase/dihydrofolate synthase family protein [Thermoguttaceae bacterium]|jgi:dihydrofolate synthase/folylpolyglutamate synthase|nr:folylpolyglutamate synthase/dihydrofolate synthase family protein [Thermoguttaceae bacterium]